MKPEPDATPRDAWPLRLFITLFGAFLGLTLLKFGNPPIFESSVAAPTDIWQFVFGSPWPIAWAYRVLGLLTALGLFTARWKLNAPPLLLALPLVWLIWQSFAASDSLDPRISRSVLLHFAACVVCFYLGLSSLSRARSLASFWLGLSLGFLFVLAIGWGQHFGGLAETRRYFYAYESGYPHSSAHFPPEYFKRLNSNRIFSTLFYPNTLAGAILLLLPSVLAAVAAATRLTIPARGFLVTAVTLGAFACLLWSGSKAGWLLMLLLGAVTLLRLPYNKKFRIALVAALLFLGLLGFFWQFAAFLKRGAPSVSARLDYWQAAARITGAHPLLGSGPGTFGSAYLAIKRPESEPARLTHNDYLEQASDSGLPGFIAYSAFILGALFWTARFQDRGAFPLWLGLLGWSLQGLFEFGLYIPALAWPAFTFLGCLLGRPSTTPPPERRL